MKSAALNHLAAYGPQEGFILRNLFSNKLTGSWIGADIAKVLYEMEKEGLVYRTKKNPKQVTWHIV